MADIKALAEELVNLSVIKLWQILKHLQKSWLTFL